MTQFTIFDCIRAVEKKYGITMRDTESYPRCYVWSNKMYSLRVYVTYLGQLRLLIVPLQDVLADRFYDIHRADDIYAALDPIAKYITVAQQTLFGAA